MGEGTPGTRTRRQLCGSLPAGASPRLSTPGLTVAPSPQRGRVGGERSSRMACSPEPGRAQQPPSSQLFILFKPGERPAQPLGAQPASPCHFHQAQGVGAADGQVPLDEEHIPPSLCQCPSGKACLLQVPRAGGDLLGPAGWGRGGHRAGLGPGAKLVASLQSSGLCLGWLAMSVLSSMLHLF